MNLPACPPIVMDAANRHADDWIEIGCVARPHGIHGEVRVKLHNAESRVLLERSEVLMRGGKTGIPEQRIDVCSARSAAEGFVLLGLAGVDSRTEAEALRGVAICVPRDALPSESEGEFYVHDIIGAKVVQSDGSTLGEVVDYISYPSTDVLVVHGAARYEIPLIEDFVHDVDSARKIVAVGDVDDFKVS